ncbi:oligosaccharide flippase family protein [Eubacterium sp. MSJ-33]|uniref:oligosaccharide flippase family protein n=1 Tax=Eubacterium sp. MSJ-33 TaxID=2841528 RepID=UPI001C76857F|nr:oligosaccharide flippase family protein [Eubacterium sp. MSJ-33]QWT52209.1 oligosaccharide flippase family protein [Eubacterium sp. MSJ-33]
MNSLAKDATLLTISKIVTLIVNMGTVMLLSRFRTLIEYGTYSEINTINTIVVSIFALGLPTSVSYFLNKTTIENEKKMFLSNYFSIASIMGIVIAIVMTVACPFLIKYYNNTLLYDYKFAILLLPWVTIINNSADNVFISYDKIKILINYRLSYSLTILSICVFVIYFGLSFRIYMMAFIGAQIIYALLVYVISSRLSGGVKFSFNRTITKEILSYSIPLGIAAVVSTINIELDNIMIGGFFSTQDLAVYSNMSKELPYNILSIAVATVLIPKMIYMLNNKKTDEAIHLWAVSIRLSAFVICLAGAATFVFSNQIISVLYSEKYLTGIWVFRVYSITSLVKITSWGIILNATKNNKYVMQVSVIILCANLILNYLFLNFIGMIGAALATAISEFLGVILKLWHSAKVINYGFSNVIPWKDLGIILSINIIGATVFCYINSYMLNTKLNKYISMIIMGVLWMGIYYVIFRKKIQEDIKQLNNMK